MTALLFFILLELYLMNQRSEAPAAPRPARVLPGPEIISARQWERFGVAVYWFRAGLGAVIVGAVLFVAVLAVSKIVLAF